MMGIFPIPGIFSHSLAQHFDLWEIPKTHKSLEILTSRTKIRISSLKDLKMHNLPCNLRSIYACLKIWEVDIA